MKSVLIDLLDIDVVCVLKIDQLLSRNLIKLAANKSCDFLTHK